MKKSCPNCKGTGSRVKKRKICEACDGTGFQDSLEVKNHFKSANTNAKAKFDLESEQDIPCEVCKGKGKIDVLEQCKTCKGTGEVNSCESCGKIIDEKYSYCKDCNLKIKREKLEEKKKAEKEKLAKQKIFVLDPMCEMDDLEVNSIYKGKITRVEKYGVFVSLNNQVWGLMRTGNPDYNVGDEIFVRISEIKSHKREVDMTPANITGDYELEKVKKNIARTKIDSLDNKSLGKIARIEGEVIQVQQTSGPTIFTITDETAITWAAAFDEAGVRVYPHIENGDIVEVIGEVNQHSGKVQIESETIEKLEGKAADKVHELIDKALDERAEPEKVDTLIKSEVLDKLQPKMRKAAKSICFRPNV
jgi:RecJ-like exonuclease